MPAWSELLIDSDAICRNLQAIQGVQIMPMVKANGYGVGMIPLAQLLSTLAVPYLGVSHLEEGCALRRSGITLPILVLSFLPEEASTVIAHHLTPVVDTLEKIDALEAVAQRSYPIHIKVNSGLNRFGTTLAHLPQLIERLSRTKHLYIEGIMTHLMGSSAPQFDTLTHQHLADFAQAVHSLPTRPQWVHAGASHGHHRFPHPLCNLARIGLFLFLPHPALTLHTRIVSIRHVAAGESVGYLGTPLLTSKTIAVLGMGYHDGWHVSYAAHSAVCFDGVCAPVIGEICMDFMMLDITHLPHLRVGDWGELFGLQRPIEEVVAPLGINPRMLVAGLGPRIQRTWNSRL